MGSQSPAISSSEGMAEGLSQDVLLSLPHPVVPSLKSANTNAVVINLCFIGYFSLSLERIRVPASERLYAEP